MFGLKIFVRVKTFRWVPPVLPCNFWHPDQLDHQHQLINFSLSSSSSSAHLIIGIIRRWIIPKRIITNICVLQNSYLTFSKMIYNQVQNILLNLFSQAFMNFARWGKVDYASYEVDSPPSTPDIMSPPLYLVGPFRSARTSCTTFGWSVRPSRPSRGQ